MICCGWLLFMLGADLPATAPARAPAQNKTMTLDLGGGVSMEMVLIQPGTFVMGSEKGEDDEKPVRRVTLTKPFYIGKFEVTQQQWREVMGENPSKFVGPTNPVDNVSWDDCQEFLRVLSEKIPKQAFKLPTEAQWEYACRAGSATAYTFGDDAANLAEYAWYKINSDGATHPVGQKKPNAWGLFDMHGNVCEWCADWYGAYSDDQTTDPTGAPAGEGRALRGESWVSVAENLRATYRVGTPVDYRNSHVGLRLICQPAGIGE
jgi:formylglycine-generating enzyme required for sulfatase activity